MIKKKFKAHKNLINAKGKISSSFVFFSYVYVLNNKDNILQTILYPEFVVLVYLQEIFVKYSIFV